MQEPTGAQKKAWPAKRIATVLVAVLVLGLFLRSRLAPVPVEVYEVEAVPLSEVVLGTGTLEARVKAVISPKIQGRLTEVAADLNDPVKSGQLLARLDDGELQQQVAFAQAALGAARASVNRIRADQGRAEAVEEQARLNHQRVAELLTTKVASQSDLDKAIEQWNVARADLTRSRAAILEAEQQVTVAEKNLLYQQERLADTRIVSPFDGLVVRRDRDPGGVVVPGSSILEVIATNEIWVSAWVDETSSTHLATGQTATVVFRSDPTNSYPGELARLGRQTDRETREFLVDVRLPRLPPNWTIGQRAEVFIETRHQPNAVAVPATFLIWQASQPGVLADEHGTARWRPVTLGLRSRDRVEIVQGLKAGERVVRSRTSKSPLFIQGRRVRPT